MVKFFPKNFTIFCSFQCLGEWRDEAIVYVHDGESNVHMFY